MNMVKKHEVEVMKFHKRLDAVLKHFQKEFEKVIEVDSATMLSFVNKPKVTEQVLYNLNQKAIKIDISYVISFINGRKN